MSELIVPPYRDYSTDSVFRNLQSLQRYALIVEVSRFLNWRYGPGKDELPLRIASLVEQLVSDAGFYNSSRLALYPSDSRLVYNYDDDQYGFRVTLDQDGDILIERDGSSLERFHEWYLRVAPSIGNFVNSLLETIRESVVGRFSNQASLASGRVVRAQHHFNFMCYDFTDSNEAVHRNHEILKRLLAGGPDEHGKPVPLGASEEYGRIDYSFTRWSNYASGFSPEALWVREGYRAEAPGNRQYSSVWYQFSFIGEGRDNGTDRSEFDADQFLNDTVSPYVTFLRDKAILGFLKATLTGYRFLTSTGRLP